MEITFVVIVGLLGLLCAYLVHLVNWTGLHSKHLEKSKKTL